MRMGGKWCRSLIISLFLAVQLVDVSCGSIAEEMTVTVLSCEVNDLRGEVPKLVKEKAYSILEGLKDGVNNGQTHRKRKVIVNEQKRGTNGEQVKLWYTQEVHNNIQIMVLVQYTDDLVKKMVKEMRDVFNTLWRDVEKRLLREDAPFNGIWGVWGVNGVLEIGIYYVLTGFGIFIFDGIDDIGGRAIHVKHRSNEGEELGHVPMKDFLEEGIMVLGGIDNSQGKRVAHPHLSPKLKEMIYAVLEKKEDFTDVNTCQFWPLKDEADEERRERGVVMFTGGRQPPEKREMKGPLVYLTYHIFQSMAYGLESLIHKDENLKTLLPLYIKYRSFNIHIQAPNWWKK